VKKLEPFHTVGGNVKWYSWHEKQYRDSSKIKKWNYHMIQQYHF
jgi:hypothetical protein